MDLEQDIYDLSSPSEIAVLRTLIDQGAIAMDEVISAIDKKKEEYVIKRHKYKIYLDCNGRWRTYYKEPGERSEKRKIISKKTKEEVYSALYDLYTHKEERLRRSLITIEELKDTRYESTTYYKYGEVLRATNERAARQKKERKEAALTEALPEGLPN